MGGECAVLMQLFLRLKKYKSVNRNVSGEIQLPKWRAGPSANYQIFIVEMARPKRK
jgi:hypothetical protein